ncbi:MAG: hypothetical protein Q8L88_16345 [Bacteroidota bacterium]|nr:hypothetical protein [Bacteroidota bacterium]
MKKYFFIPILLFFTSCHEGEISTPSDSNANISYPTILRPLAKPFFDSVQKTFQQKLGTSYIAKLDSFGFVGHLDGITRGKSNVSDKMIGIAKAKAAILYLKEYTNVYDSSVEVKYAKKTISPGITDWEVLFKNQVYAGLEVWDSAILTIVADDFVLIDGHYYNNIFIPHQNIISREQVKANLLGQKYEFYCWGPLDTLIITDSLIRIETMEQCIYPLIKKNTVELRVVWKVPIYTYSGSSSPMWYYFVDILTGEIVAIRQLFIC